MNREEPVDPSVFGRVERISHFFSQPTDRVTVDFSDSYHRASK